MTCTQSDRAAERDEIDELEDDQIELITELEDNWGWGGRVACPPGWGWGGKTLYRIGKNGPFAIYDGIISVIGVGADLVTGERTISIGLEVRGRRVVVDAPHASVGRARDLIALLGARGAAIHDENAKHVSAYLISLVAFNADLPERVISSRLGLAGDALVLPGGAVGHDQPAIYAGQHAWPAAGSLEAWRTALTAALAWDAPALWLVTAASLASPLLARLKPRRYPVLMIAGPSGSGKTTLAQFALSAWSTPTHPALSVQAGATRRAGYLQTLEHLRGLPLLIDEAHNDASGVLEEIAYSFANGQSYTRGTTTGQTAGATPLAGSLLLCGEITPLWRNAGSANRLLLIDGVRWTPLGAAAQSELGRQRALELERAARDGAGAAGMAVAQHVWPCWGEFAAEVRAAAADLERAHAGLSALGGWAEVLAALLTTLNWALEALGVEAVPPGFWDGLEGAWISMLQAGRRAADPAEALWDALAGALAQCERQQDGGWELLSRRGEVIAGRKTGDAHWRVITPQPALQRDLNVQSLTLHARAWADVGRLELAQDGLATHQARVRGQKCRVMLLRASALSGEDEG